MTDGCVFVDYKFYFKYAKNAAPNTVNSAVISYDWNRETG